MSFLPWLYLMGSCYLIGAFPSAYLAGRLLRGLDIRAVGDHNPGAENVWRHVSHLAGLTVATIDIGKGALAALAARALVNTDGAAMLGGFFAVAGHNWPVFMGFRGGRGAATALGVLLLLIPRLVFPLGLVAAVPLFLTRSTTVAFAFVYVPLPLVAWYMGVPTPFVAYSVALPVIVGISHFITLRRVAREERST
ncbi:MAG: glycerol-3-phosphate acyltransferase [Chloroflexi bacterium]|nr:glycerol-3-phosphate acyltransferase [Chloroflexota bacterium]